MSTDTARTLAEIEAETNMVAEGVKNSVAVSRLARQRGVDMPIVEQMVEILYHGKPPAQALRDLMTRELKAEAELRETPDSSRRTRRSSSSTSAASTRS